MTKDEALDLALDALTHLQPTALNSFYTIGARDKAINAIKQALAAQVQGPKETDFSRALRLYDEAGDRLLPAKPAHVQEPVEFFDWYDNAHWGNEDFKEGCHRSWNAAIKYTTPPAAQRQWVGLTDEEYSDLYFSVGYAENVALWKAIEANLKEKNT